jgi:hypothetical protein
MGMWWSPDSLTFSEIDPGFPQIHHGKSSGGGPAWAKTCFS